MTLGQNNFSVFNEVNIKRRTFVNINLVLKDISEIPSKFFFFYALKRNHKMLAKCQRRQRDQW